MKNSTTELTINYIKEHPYIKNCLKKGLINYSSLARLISKELKIQKKSSLEAILVAARRYQETLKEEIKEDNKIKSIILNSELNIKNKVSVIILKKDLQVKNLNSFQKNKNSVFYFLEGTSSYTIISGQENTEHILELYKDHIIKEQHELALVGLVSSKEIEKTTGVISYLTALFSENQVNIVEFLSCWKDTIFIIEKKDVSKVLQFMNF